MTTKQVVLVQVSTLWVTYLHTVLCLHYNVYSKLMIFAHIKQSKLNCFKWTCLNTRNEKGSNKTQTESKFVTTNNKGSKNTTVYKEQFTVLYKNWSKIRGMRLERQVWNGLNMLRGGVVDILVLNMEPSERGKRQRPHRRFMDADVFVWRRKMLENRLV